MAAHGCSHLGSVLGLWIKDWRHSTQHHVLLLSPAHLQTSHLRRSINVLTYQTSWVPTFQHSLICQLSHVVSLTGSVFPVISSPAVLVGCGCEAKGMVMETSAVNFALVLWQHVLLGPKTWNRDPPVLLQPPLQLPPGKASPLGDSCGAKPCVNGGNGGIQDLTLILQAFISLGTWEPSSCTALQGGGPGHAPEAKGGQAALGHLQGPDGIPGLPRVRWLAGRAYHLFCCSKGCLHW